MKLYEIIMKCDFKGSDDGIHVTTFKKGEVYKVGETLYNCFKKLDLIKEPEKEIPKQPEKPVVEVVKEKKEEEPKQPEKKMVTEYENKAVKTTNNKGTNKGRTRK